MKLLVLCMLLFCEATFCFRMASAEIYFSKSHVWVKVDGDSGTIGITDYAQGILGDVVFDDLPEVGDHYKKDDAVLLLEGVATARAFLIPVSGKITDTNTGLENSPELVNEEPFLGGWLVKMKLSNPSELSSLMTKTAYDQMISDLNE